MKKILLCTLIISSFSLHSGSKKNKGTPKVPPANLDGISKLIEIMKINDKHRRTRLIESIVNNKPEYLKFLLKYQNIGRVHFSSITDELLSSLLILAYGLENDAIVAILLEKGARVITKDLTALHVASLEGSSNAITALIKKGAPINATTNKGFTSLHLAVQEGYQEVVELLLEHNADINATTDDGETPLSIAKEKGHADIIKLLEEYKPSK